MKVKTLAALAVATVSFIGVSSVSVTKELAAAVAEWVDGDNIAAHVAYNQAFGGSEERNTKGASNTLRGVTL